MACKEYSELEIGALADGFLEEAEAAPVRLHLESCAACASLYRDLLRIHNALSGDYFDPPDTLVPGVMYKISLHRKGKRRLSFGWVTMAAAALALIVLAGPLRDWVLPPGADSAPEPLYAAIERSWFAMEWDEGIPPAGMPPAQFDMTVGDAETAAQATSGASGPGIARMALGEALFGGCIEIYAQNVPDWLPDWLREHAEATENMVASRTMYYFIDPEKMDYVMETLLQNDVPFEWRADDDNQNADYRLVIILP
jgi:anti-sigma factor RsiW